MSQALEIAHGDFGRVALLDMDRSLVRHAHHHCHVLLKVEGDDTHFLVGERVVRLTDEQAVLNNAWETHAYLHDPACEKAMILALYIEPAWLGSFRQNWSASGAPGFFEQPVGLITTQIRRLARDLAAEMVYAPDSGLIRETLLPGLMIALIERFTAWRETGTSLRIAGCNRDWRVQRAITRIRSEPSTGTGIGALAREVGLSRAHFYRLFEQTTGASPNVFKNAIRIERAVRAIVDTEQGMTDLSAGLGFSTPAHFSRFFRDHVGVAPSVFRNIVRRNCRPLS